MHPLILPASRQISDHRFHGFSDIFIVRLKCIRLACEFAGLFQESQKYLTELAEEGLTEGKITTLTTQRETLDVAIDAQSKGISDRDLATEGRIEALNRLYRLLTKYAGIGQDIFYETNEAKYNDYIIYNTQSGLPEVPPQAPL